ncbi:short-chain dehydrogenase [Nocardioides silvaticus]|uniref:Short-chain dehydrogenase n=1 Tax=Nocardioides silvaticus TaxID=2201891 RepID=A0A316TNP2_9ACTN|nr:SDR family oxidoreductase [Nocardioides silvaticus]PWN04829.1 short-chain dehydrogenase [Nocardioides silvaticus]
MADLCVVVGATGTMGRAVTERLVKRGQRVLAVGRDEAALATLADQVAGVAPCVADIADDAAVATIGAAVDAPVRMAVFAAGLPIAGSVETVAPSDLARGADIKLGGLLRLVRAVDDRLERGSRIVMFAGTLGLEPKPSSAGPGAINAGVLNLMRQLADVYGPRGITTHTLSPGPTESPRLHALVERAAAEKGITVAEQWASYAAQTSLDRLPRVEEIAWAVTLLLDPEADALHGGVLHLDAGGQRSIV